MTLTLGDKSGESAAVDLETRDAFERLERTLREEITTRVGAVERTLREEIETQVAGVRSYVDTRLVETQSALETRIVESEERTRRHFDVVGESLRGDIRLLAEGITAVADASIRRDTEINGRIDRLEHRVLGLESRVSHLETPRPPRRRPR